MSTSRPALVASYRVQLTPDFGFDQAAGLLDHLGALGVSHVYVSPIAEAIPGSLHGYDVIDHTVVRADFGGADGLERLLDAADRYGLGVVIDHVPNHMSAAEAHLNDRWWEMLRDGPSSPSAAWFDVDWVGGGGKVLVPKLGAPLGEIIAGGGLELGAGDLGPELRCGPLRFPLAPGTEDLDLATALERQHYRLQWWREPARNVRRFFTIDDLVAVRAEDPHVAAEIDTLPVRLRDHPAFAGVRVDHVDGLADPGLYLAGLRERIGRDRWLVVEKIVAPGEWLPPSWPVDGTTGYEHIRVTEHTFLHPDAERPLLGLWHDLTGDGSTFGEVENLARRQTLRGGLRPDLERLVRTVEASRYVDDPLHEVRLTRRDDRRVGDEADALRDAVVELTIGLHRYRTYLPADPASDAELETAQARAVTARPDLRDELTDLVELIREVPAVTERWQQLTSPVMAKGAEDRAFYRYLPLASLCEVGGDPGTFTTGVEQFHAHHRRTQAVAPLAMLAGTTHDTKRSEGVRARSLALAEVADDWQVAARAWIAGRDHDVDAATVLLALQTVVTAWPIDAERLTEYLVKSAREAELHTAWTAVDDGYERGLGRLATELIDEVATGTGQLATILDRLLRPGWSNSLAALAVRLTAPGVPDLYQGTSAFTYSLVDPDNRLEPDWDERRELVARARQLDGPTAWLGDDHEASKAVLIVRALRTRRQRPGAFGGRATYRPLEFSGALADRLLGFVRGDDRGAAVVTIVVMRSLGVGSWADTAVVLPDGSWRNVLDDTAEVVSGGGSIVLERTLMRFPVAILERDER